MGSLYSKCRLNEFFLFIEDLEIVKTMEVHIIDWR